MTVSRAESAVWFPLALRAFARIVALATVTFFVGFFANAVAQMSSAPKTNSPLSSSTVPPAPLPVDSAFPMTASFDKTRRGDIVLKIDVQPGHYLYRDRFEFERDGEGVYTIGKFKQRADADLKTKNDPHFGTVKVYDTPITLTVGHTARTKSKLTVVYQGCSELAGVCYPPTKRTFDVSGVGVEVAANEVVKPGLGSLFKKNVSQ
jgi:thiol:disulfide interchange protein